MNTPQLESIAQLAKRSGLSVRSLQRTCDRLGIVKVGWSYILTPEQSARVVAATPGKVGCPLFGKKDSVASAKKQKASGKSKK